MSAKALVWIAFGVFGAALITGFAPVTSQGSNCGSAFVESRDAGVDDLVDAFSGRMGSAEDSCKELRSILRIPAFILLGAGICTLIAAGVASGKEEQRREAAREAENTSEA